MDIGIRVALFRRGEFFKAHPLTQSFQNYDSWTHDREESPASSLRRALQEFYFLEISTLLFEITLRSVIEVSDSPSSLSLLHATVEAHNEKQTD
jgi:hypothetical protein